MENNKQNKSSKISYLRILLVLIIIIGGFVFDYYFKNFKSKAAQAKPKAKEKQEEPISTQIKNSTEKALDQALKGVENTVDDVLGIATDFVSQTASNSADAMKDLFYDNTAGVLLKQINKLPNKQKKEIKEEICK